MTVIFLIRVTCLINELKVATNSHELTLCPPMAFKVQFGSVFCNRFGTSSICAEEYIQLLQSNFQAQQPIYENNLYQPEVSTSVMLHLLLKVAASRRKSCHIVFYFSSFLKFYVCADRQKDL